MRKGLDKGKIKNVYNHISVFLGQDNKKFQISKIAHGARSQNMSARWNGLVMPE